MLIQFKKGSISTPSANVLTIIFAKDGKYPSARIIVRDASLVSVHGSNVTHILSGRGATYFGAPNDLPSITPSEREIPFS